MDNPGYYAILPANVRYDNRLKAAEKILYCEITALSDANGYCHAGNGYFADLYGVDDSTIRRWIRSLKNLGYVDVVYCMEGDAQQRRITPCGAYPEGGHDVPASGKNARPPRAKMPDPPGQNCPHNNTSINNTRDNNISAGAREGLDVLDEFAGEDRTLQDALHAFYDNRREIKKPMTRRACVVLCTTLSKMVSDAKVKDRTGYMVAALNESIMNGWQGVFAPKDFVDRAPVVHSPGGAAPAPRQIGPDDDISQYF
ncbi:MAG TPA: helix-turn-helix domain-containing protein [Candidatus Gemmiger excrementavium]|uniref:Helix-turn-helix domain-containing protein n=1 Tax=Candidatus Gemmiger excrementavium TaxID=2838608 RepID=A0A9D2F3K5_9FIRM|nr:helix-turn-helix domain-containing protein [Candidatus Gemmiger excrementavium]